MWIREPGIIPAAIWDRNRLIRHDHKDKTFAANFPTARIKRVCQQCNNEWMARMEADCKPLLVPLIQGQGLHEKKPLDISRAIALQASEQIRIASWGYKTGLMLALIADEELVPESHYRYLYTHRVPPPNAAVWLAGYRGGMYMTMSWTRDLFIGTHPPTPDTPPNAYMVHFNIGRLVVMVLGIVPEFIPARPHPGPRVHKDAILRIWPPNVFVQYWSPRILMDDGDLRSANDQSPPEP